MKAAVTESSALSVSPAEMVVESLYAKRIPVLFVAALQITSSSGILYGWSSLRVVLESSTGVESDTLTLWYLIAAFSNMAMLPVSGGFLDNFGPRFCSAFFLCIVSLGLTLLGGGYILPGLICIGSAGSGVQISLLHLAALFPERPSMVLASLTGCYQVSFAVFLGYKLVYTAQILDFSTLCFGHAGVCFFLLLTSLVLWPDLPIDASVVRSIGRSNGSARHPHQRLSSPLNLPQPEPLSSVIRSKQFIRLAIWFSVSIFWLNLFIAVVNDEVHAMTQDEGQRDLLINLFSITLPLGVFWSPVQGYIIDRYGFPVGISISIFISTLFSGLSALQMPSLTYFAFFVNAIARVSLFSTVYAYVGTTFGSARFGRLNGIIFLIASMVGLLQYPMLQIFGGQYQIRHMVAIVFFVLLQLYPVQLWAESGGKGSFAAKTR